MINKSFNLWISMVAVQGEAYQGLQRYGFIKERNQTINYRKM